MNLEAILLLGFFLGMRHAIDPDHMVAVTAIVTRERTLRAAAPIGILWGLGHTVTVLVVGGAIILLRVVIPPRLGLGFELAVAVMLVAIGAVNVRSALAKRSEPAHGHEPTSSAPAHGRLRRSQRALLVGIVHGLAGSAAAALLALGSIRGALSGMTYLVVFGLGTVAGMFLVTTALAVSVAAAAGRFRRLHRGLGFATGLASVAFGMALFYEIGFVGGLFTSQPQWTPH
jgi:hypothetical protein